VLTARRHAHTLAALDDATLRDQGLHRSELAALAYAPTPSALVVCSRPRGRCLALPRSALPATSKSLRDFGKTPAFRLLRSPFDLDCSWRAATTPASGPLFNSSTFKD
jgi:hypothetical protein